MAEVVVVVVAAVAIAMIHLYSRREGMKILIYTKCKTYSKFIKRHFSISFATGHTKVAPCWGMCLNVMRGCLAQVTEIDRNWNQYINALEDLIGVMKSK